MIHFDDLNINFSKKDTFMIKGIKLGIYKFILKLLNERRLTNRQLTGVFSSLIVLFTRQRDSLKSQKNKKYRGRIITMNKFIGILKNLKGKCYKNKDIKNILRKRINKVGKIIDSPGINMSDSCVGTSDDLSITPTRGAYVAGDFAENLYNINGRSNIINDTLKYYDTLNTDEKKKYNMIINDIKNVKYDKPYIIRLLNSDIDNRFKKHIISMINNAYNDNNAKLNSWIDNVRRLPFGIYKGNNFEDYKSVSNVKKLLENLQKDMDSAVFGHDKAKRKIVQFVAQKISNPKSKGNVLGLYGPPGNGKTSLIKNGIAKALNRPFVFISLGGAQDSSFLEGHGFTYEGSIYGKIADGIINSGCMNPIIYFDELDKVSNTSKGREIINLLIHMIDPVQNKHFVDKYFHGLEFDLSKCTFIFSFNEPRKVNYILLDRITKVETKFLSLAQKKIICKNYLLPNMLKEFGLENKKVTLTDYVVNDLILNYTREGGVRGLKKLLRHIISEINLETLTDNNITFPLKLTKDKVMKYIKDFHKRDNQMIHNDYMVGVINGMWAGSMGVGGILPIEVMLIPNKAVMTVKATGSLEKVIKESTEVACSLAWSRLNVQLKNKWLEEWKRNPQGFHIHCPEGAVSKDGPSAGTALTVAIYSVLTNKPIKNNISITGEINLQGMVLIIGGLEEKLLGAKRAGVNLALIPYGNLKDIERIKKRNSKLFDDKFSYRAVKTLDDVLQHVF